MLTHPTHDRLVALGLTGMAKALEEQRNQPDIAALSFEERLALMVDREAIERENKRLVNRLKFASLRQSAVVEDVDMKSPRGLDKALFAKLVAGDWITRHQGLLICGPTGTGKSWLACALGHKACRDNRSVLYQRVPRLFDALALARGDGRHARLLKSLSRVELLILDDWGLASLTPEQGRDMLEIVEDRHNRGSTIVTSQLPVDHWHETIANPTIADAIDTPNGSAVSSPPTTTLRSPTIITRCHSVYCARRSRSVSPIPPSRSSTRASGLPAIRARACTIATRLSLSTCRARIGVTPSGPRNA